MNTLKRFLSIISICVLCLAAQAQVVKGVTRTGEEGTAGQELPFVDRNGNIVNFPALSRTGEIVDVMQPSVVTNSTVTDITKNSAVTGGKIVAQGAGEVTECGVCYGTSANPTVIGTHVTATPDADGTFTVNLTGLQPNTTYHVRAYATNAIGTSYGTDYTFTTRGEATITITGKSESKVYNAQEQSLSGYTVSIPEGVNIAETEISYTGNAAATGTNAGEYTLTFNAAHFSCSNSNYDVTFQVAPGKLTITPAPATVTANDASKVYGTADPASFTATVTGMQGTDAASLITYSVTRAAGENVGTYAITPSGNATQGNYNVTYVPANFTITKASATVTITGNTDSKTYTATAQSVTGYTVSIPDGVNIAETDISCSTNATASGTNAGIYYMGLSADNFSCSNGNYNVTFTVTDGSLTINKATAKVTGPYLYINYGEVVPTLTATETGVLGNDHLDYTLYLPTSFENHGNTNWAIGVQLGDNPNYEVTPVQGLLTIRPIAATIKVDNKTKVYGNVDPDFTATVTGTINGDVLNYTLSRATGEDVGEYTITATKDPYNNDYTVTVTNGTLTITPAPATVKADDKTKVAGEDDPTFTATVTGLKRNDQPSVLNYSLSRATGETAGSYTITPSGAATQGNYAVTYQTGTLTITEPACPTLGTTYTPDPVTSSATTITLTTPVNDVASGVTLTNPQYTATMGNTSVTVNNVSYSNGTMTGTITITSAMRGKAITVTPSITTSGCSNSGTVTGQEVEICVPYATKPSLASLKHNPTSPMGKKDLFSNDGVDLSVTVSNYTASQVESYGFLISTDQSDIQSYSSEFAVSATKSGSTITSTKLGLSYCGKKWYYRAYIKLNGCEEPELSTINNFQMWGPEINNNQYVAGPVVSATPNSVIAGNEVTLSATAYMTVGTANMGTHSMEEWMNYQNMPEYQNLAGQDCEVTYLGVTFNMSCQSVVSTAVNTFHLSTNNWTYYWLEGEYATAQELNQALDADQSFYSNHTSGTTTVNPTQTTIYTAVGEFKYTSGGTQQVCRVSKSIPVTVQ